MRFIVLAKAVTASLVAIPLIVSPVFADRGAPPPPKRAAVNKIVVKFSSESGVGTIADRLPGAGEALKQSASVSALTTLNARFGVVSVKKLFKSALAPSEPEMDNLSGLAEFAARATDEFQTHVSEVKSRFSKRAARAPSNAQTPDFSRVYVFELRAGTDAHAAAQAYSQMDGVLYAHPDTMGVLHHTPNDPFFSSSNSWNQGYDDLWGLKNMELGAAWDVALGNDVIVAVVDTGVDYTHADLNSNIYTGTDGTMVGYDFSDDDNDPDDYYGHGTHVAGTIAAIADNSFGITGVAPQAKIMPVKVFPNAYSSVLALGLIFAADNGADVINNSWGSSSEDTVIGDAIDYAVSMGAVVVFSAGNDNYDVNRDALRNKANILLVGSTDTGDIKSDFSNWGGKVDISAPGGNSANSTSNADYLNILSLLASTNTFSSGLTVDTNFVRIRGTSMAAPHITGLAALIVGLNPDWGVGQIMAQAVNSADNIDHLNPEYIGLTGRGRANARRALTTEATSLIKLVALVADDSVNSDGDKTPSPGERVDLKITLKNYSGVMTNITVDVTTEPPGIFTTLPTAQLGSMEPLSFATATIPTTVAPVEPGTRFTYLVTITSDRELLSGELIETTYHGRFGGVVGFNSVPTFPTAIDEPFEADRVSSPLVTDYDNDGTQEVAYSFNGKVYFKENGTYVNGWPVSIPSPDASGLTPSVSHLAAVDIDGDGDLEIVASFFAQDWGLVAWHAQSGAVVSGWPRTGLDKVHDFCLAEIDGLTGAEVVAHVGQDINVIRHNNTNVPNWPIPWYSPYPSLPSYYLDPVDSSRVAVADIDGDSQNEIVVALCEHDDGWFDDTCHVAAYESNGATVSGGWPYFMVWGTHTWLSLVDIDNDGAAEIVVSDDCIEIGDADCNDGPSTMVLDATGSPIGNWPIARGGPIVAADVDGDGFVEVVIAEQDALSVFTSTGTMKYSVPVSNMPAGLLVADLDGDNDPEILHITDKGLAITDGPGSTEIVIPDYCLYENAFYGNFYNCSGPAVADLDGDNGVDLLYVDLDTKELFDDLDYAVQLKAYDFNGIGDYEDLCLEDPLKIAPGQCGCGTPDADTDMDGVADCVDGCPEYSLKTAPGICGCDYADIDNDGDGVLDCVDECPSDPLKTVPGECGCGIQDLDANGNSNCLDVETPSLGNDSSSGGGCFIMEL